MTEFQCRTCLAVRNSKLSFSLDGIVLGRTLKEIILPFLPDKSMVSSVMVRNIICCECYQTLKTFVEFIEKCNEVEGTLKRINDKIIEHQSIVATVPDSNCAPEGSRSYNGSKVKFRQQQKSAQGSLPELQDHCYFDPEQLKHTYSTKTNKTPPITPQTNETQVEKPNGLSNNAEISNSETETAESGDVGSDISWAVDGETNQLQVKVDTDSVDTDSDIYWTADGETYQLKTIGTDSMYKLPILDSLDHYEMQPHDRTLSFAQPGDNFPQLLNDFAETGMDILQVNFPASVPNSARKKRLLLFGSVVLQCPECYIQLKDSDELNTHYKLIHKDKPLPKPEKEMFDVFLSKRRRKTVSYCPVCEKNFATRLMLTQHLQRAHKDFMPYKCEKCDKKFRMKASYQKHLQNYETFGNCNYRKCRRCSEMIHNDQYAEHLKTHRDIVCEECGRLFATVFHLARHKTSHRTNNEKHLCSFCGKLFAQANNLKNHLRIHEEISSNITYMCDKCARVYPTQWHLNKHVKKAHERKHHYECPECNKKCSTRSALKQHNRLKHSMEHSHSCQICGKQFVRGDYFRRHMKWHIITEDGKRGVKNTKRYLRSKFDLPRCKYCSKLCKNLYILRQHLMTHVKTMRYSCRYCKLTFANPTNKYRHEKRHKDPNFELSCKVCWKRMETKEELDIHHAKHKMNRKYKCGECGEMLSSKYYFRHHMSEKHITKEDIEKEKSTVLEDALGEFLIRDD